MESFVKVDVEMRDAGKRVTQALRKQEKIPAIVYGAVPNNLIALTKKTFVKYLDKHFENTFFHLQCEKNNQIHNVPVLIKSLERDPVTRDPLHLDFYAPNMTKEVSVTIEVTFTGKAIGEKEGGVLEVMQRNIRLSCLPGQIPQQMLVDVSWLKMGDVYHISDLKLPAGVKSAVSTDLPLCAVKEARKTVVEAPAPSDEKTASTTDAKSVAGKDKEVQKPKEAPQKKK